MGTWWPFAHVPLIRIPPRGGTVYSLTSIATFALHFVQYAVNFPLAFGISLFIFFPLKIFSLFYSQIFHLLLVSSLVSFARHSLRLGATVRSLR